MSQGTGLVTGIEGLTDEEREFLSRNGILGFRVDNITYNQDPHRTVMKGNLWHHVPVQATFKLYQSPINPDGLMGDLSVVRVTGQSPERYTDSDDRPADLTPTFLEVKSIAGDREMTLGRPPKVQPSISFYTRRTRGSGAVKESWSVHCYRESELVSTEHTF